MSATDPETRTPTREEWAAITAKARRVGRFKHALNRARKDVTTDPRMTADELATVAQIYLDAAREAVSS